MNILPPVEYRKIIWGDGPANDIEIPKIIWLYWDGVINSPLVKTCINNLKIYLPDYTIHILNADSVQEFLPNYKLEKRDELPLANYTDLVRLNLLEVYGGIWLDASILITQNFDWVQQLKTSTNVELVAFYSDAVTNDFAFPILETWFLAAPKNANIIRDWHHEFRNCYYSENPHKYYSAIKENPLFVQNIKDGDLQNYLIAYLSAIKIMRKNKSNYRILMISANDVAHFYKFNLQIKNHLFGELFLRKPTPKFYPIIIKFEKHGRKAIDDDINLGRYTKNSFLFTIAQDPNYMTNKFLRKMNYFRFLLSNVCYKYLKIKI